ncbi:MAG: immunogenic protein [Lachnospiraceae bacterium]|nr:immunogenic protein [Lachnospiraceae bacterium]
MKTVIRITLITLMLLSLFGCSKKEPSVVKTYETTDLESVDENSENDEWVTMVNHYEMSDGTWKTDDDEHTYQYRLEITGRMGDADKDSTFVFLSNIKDITFEQAWKASGFSSNMDDYFKREDARFVAMK